MSPHPVPIHLVGLQPAECPGLVEALLDLGLPHQWMDPHDLPADGAHTIIASAEQIRRGIIPRHGCVVALTEGRPAQDLEALVSLPAASPAQVFAPLLQVIHRKVERLQFPTPRSHWHTRADNEGSHGGSGEHAMDASERRFRRVVEHSGEGMGLLALDGTWLMANPAAERLFGCPGGTLVGRNLTESLFADQARRFRAVLESLEAGVPTSFDCEIQAEEGPRRWLWATITRLPQEYDAPAQAFWVFRDITERRKTLNALANSEARLKAAIASAPILLLSLSREGRVTLAQGLALEVLEVPPEDLIGHTAEALADRLPLIREAHQRGMEGDERPWSVHLRDLEFMATLSPLPAFQGHPGGWILTLVDITDRRKAERAAWNEEKLRSLVQMAGGAAHDFNNLFQTLQGRLELASASPELPPQVLHHLKEAQATLSRASRLSSQLLQFSGGTRYSFASLHLGPFLRETFEGLRQRDARIPEPRWELPVSLPTVWADADALRQVIGELVYNALEAGDDSPQLTVKATPSQIRSEVLLDAQGQMIPEGPFVVLEIQDKGPGMHAETLRRIFDPFFSTKLPGRGLGLPAVLGILQSHGAAIQADSDPGIGTRMRIYLPLDVATVTPGLQDGPPLQALRPQRGQILVVDDERDVRQITCDMLGLLGHPCLEARDGREAVEIYKLHQQDIDLVVMDMTMPVLNGQEAFQAMHALDPGVRVIIASGYAQATVWEAFRSEKPLGFLQKPYTFRELEECLEAADMTASCS